MRVAIILLITGLLTFQGCNNMAAFEDGDMGSASIEERLQYQIIEPAQLSELITLPAQVEAKPKHRYQLSAPAQARVLAVLVREGELVDAKTPLARLQIPSLSAWRDMEAAARNSLKAASQKVALEQEKLELGVGSRAVVQEALVNEASAKMVLAQLEADRKAANSSGLHSEGKTSLSFLWNAGRTGVITHLKISAGETISSGQPAFTLVDASQVEVLVHAPERLLSHLESGVQLQWQPSGLPAEEAPQILTLSRRGGVVDPISRTVPLYFEGQPRSPGDPHFMPGRSGRGALMTKADANIWKTPHQAVCRMGGQDGVFVQGDDPQKPHWIVVEVVGRKGDDLLLRSDALHAGAHVVVRGTFLLKSIRLLKEES